MALLATHVRFALDIKDSLGVNDTQQYLSGALYPDSRNLTKVDRALTHPASLIIDYSSKLTDFQKGWYSHVLYDVVLKQFTDQSLGDLINSSPQNLRYALYTALKILQDIQDAKTHKLGEYIQQVSIPTPLLGENVEVLAEYYNVIKSLYSDPTKLEVASYKILYDIFGASPDFVSAINLQLVSLQNNEVTKRFIQTVYSDTLQLAKKDYIHS